LKCVVVFKAEKEQPILLKISSTCKCFSPQLGP